MNKYMGYQRAELKPKRNEQTNQSSLFRLLLLDWLRNIRYFRNRGYEKKDHTI